jgi:hypothetical protein
LGDLLRVGQADRAPALASIGGAEHPDALRDIGAHVGFTRADIDDVRRRRGDRDGADRADVHILEERLPRPASVVGAPDAAVHRAEIEAPRVLRIADHRKRSPTPERPDRAPMQLLEKPWIDARSRKRSGAPSSGSARRSLVRNRTGIILPEWRDSDQP